MKTVPSWDQISEELLVLISQRLTLPDKIRFGCVCPFWRSLSAPARHGKLPWLMLPYNNEDYNGSFGFFSLYDRMVYKFELPEVAGTRIYRCSLGWLITVHDDESKIHLLHPFSRERIELPSLNTFQDIMGTSYSKQPGLSYDYMEMYFWAGVIFSLSSSRTSSKDCIVMASYGLERKLAFCRPGDNEWTAVKTPLEDHGISYYKSYKNILYCNGQFCTLDSDSRVAFCDLGSSPRVTTNVLPSPMKECPRWEYLVNWSGQLLRVLGHVKYLSDADDSGNSSVLAEWVADKFKPFKYEFKVYKLDFELQRWIKVKTLGDNVLFLSNSVSLALPARHCEGDRIYFVDDGDGSYNACGEIYSLSVFNMVDGTTQICFQTDNRLSMHVPMWIAA